MIQPVSGVADIADIEHGAAADILLHPEIPLVNQRRVELRVKCIEVCREQVLAGIIRNDVSGDSNWLKVKLVGTKSNRSAIGATIVVRYGDARQAQAVLSQSSFHSVNDSRLHFGLGEAKSANLEIRWPSGHKQTINQVAANRLAVIEEGRGPTSSDPLPR